MDLSFILSLLSVIWQMISGWISILGGLGIDGISSLAGILGGAK